MWLRTQCYLEFDITTSTPFIFMLRPRSGAQQWIAKEEYRHLPYVPITEFTDSYSNLCQRLIAPVGKFSIYTKSEVMTSDFSDSSPSAPFMDIAQLPDSILFYLLPSRYCESDKLLGLAADITQGYLLGYDQVSAIEHWIRANIKYEIMGSETQLSALEVTQRGTGVCRDFSHLGIALCRSLSIPARLVVGYLYGLEPMDLKGGYVSIGYGRDATDVAVFNQFGPPSYPVQKNISVELIQNTKIDFPNS